MFIKILCYTLISAMLVQASNANVRSPFGELESKLITSSKITGDFFKFHEKFKDVIKNISRVVEIVVNTVVKPSKNLLNDIVRRNQQVSYNVSVLIDNAKDVDISICLGMFDQLRDTATAVFVKMNNCIEHKFLVPFLHIMNMFELLAKEHIRLVDIWDEVVSCYLEENRSDIRNAKIIECTKSAKDEEIWSSSTFENKLSYNAFHLLLEDLQSSLDKCLINDEINSFYQKSLTLVEKTEKCVKHTIAGARITTPRIERLGSNASARLVPRVIEHELESVCKITEELIEFQFKKFKDVIESIAQEAEKFINIAVKTSQESWINITLHNQEISYNISMLADNAKDVNITKCLQTIDNLKHIKFTGHIRLNDGIQDWMIYGFFHIINIFKLYAEEHVIRLNNWNNTITCHQNIRDEKFSTTVMQCTGTSKDNKAYNSSTFEHKLKKLMDELNVISNRFQSFVDQYLISEINPFYEYSSIVGTQTYECIKQWISRIRLIRSRIQPIKKHHSRI